MRCGRPGRRRWVGGGCGKRAVCSLDIALTAWRCPFAQFRRSIRGHTSEKIVRVTFGMLGGSDQITQHDLLVSLHEVFVSQAFQGGD
jgi:hypothetical protein